MKSPESSTLSVLIARLASALDGGGIPYMVIGGQAVLLYGTSRLTQDIDVTLGVGAEEFARVVQSLGPLKLDCLTPEPKNFVRDKMVLPLRDPSTGFRVDLMFTHSFSTYERQALVRARQVAVGKTMVRYISPEDLVIHKIIAGRPRDLEDVKGILLKNPEVNRKEIKDWLVKFGQDQAIDYLERFQEIDKRLEEIPGIPKV